jgi:hypothetical protein
MSRYHMLSTIDRAPRVSREVVEAWIIIVLLACATLIGVVLDRFATVSF